MEKRVIRRKCGLFALFASKAKARAPELSVTTTTLPNPTPPKMSSRIPSYRKDDRTRPSRSRSPRRHPQPSHSHRERSPPRQHGHHKRKRSPDPTSITAPKDLPLNGRQLGKRDYEAFKPMFALYMDIQKGKVLEEMDETEIKGRWKSFLGKW
jgi:hypothetical protein